jgi:hypothetical protein
LWGEPAHESATRRMEVRGNKSGDDGNGFSHVLGPVWGKMMLMRAAQRCKPQNSNTSRSTAVWGVYRTDQCASAGGLGGLTPAPHRVGPTTCPHLRKLANVQNLQTHRTTSVLIPEQIRDFWRGLVTLWPWGQRSRAWWTTTVGRDGMKTMQTLAKVSRTRIPCPSTTHAANCLRATHIL